MENRSAVLLEDETLRDGLQVERKIFSLEEKLQIFEMLEGAGVQRIQVGSFVHPTIVPQMANTAQFIQAIKEQAKGTTLLSGLILNGKGLERALDAGLEHLSMSVSVSDSHSQKNARKSTEDALNNMVSLVKDAVASGVKVRSGLQCSFGCVYEGEIDPQKVLDAAIQFSEAGVSEINLADTTGMANPDKVASLVKLIKSKLPDMDLSLHVHDTRGLGLLNMYVAYRGGIRIFDVCAGGLGGCPFVKGGAGNAATEDAVNMFAALGVETGVNIEGVCAVVDVLEQSLERKLPGKMGAVLKSGICV